jgi:hypothetical protein
MPIAYDLTPFESIGDAICGRRNETILNKVKEKACKQKTI